jgi:hypothetical protein
MTQFRPISLCNVIYKTISKVLANRLKSVLPSIISESQSAFVPGRLISDNILVAFESLHYMKNKRKGKSTHMAAKLDMSKAYDRVEWGYLEAIMVKMGFHERWVSLIMNCLTSVRYAVLFNGSTAETFLPTRGIRQGDPLSPYLFLLCAEGLTALLCKANLDFSLRGIAVCRNGPRVTHLMFADDCMLFFRANIEECQVVIDILSQYEEASGQKLNNDKTSIFYSSNTPHDTRIAIGNLLGAPNSNSIERYLGLPPFLGRSKIKAFEDLSTKVWKKLKGWKEKLLSQAGKEILIKAVTQALPVYAMSCFQIPDGICASINSMNSNFWWGQRNKERRMHWKKWETMCLSKKEGGMGFKNLKLFNQALLAKQCWRLLHNPNTLIGQIFKARYFPSSSFMEASIPNHSSFTWRSIAQARKVITMGSRWCVGDGESISIWNDKWIPTNGGQKVISPMSRLQENAKVRELFTPSLS